MNFNAPNMIHCYTGGPRNMEAGQEPQFLSGYAKLAPWTSW